MKKIWSEEMKEYLLTIYKGRFIDDIRDLVNNKFGLNLTSCSVKSFLANNHLKTGYRNDGRNNRQFKDEWIEWIKANRYGYHLKEFVKMFNDHFNTSLSEEKIRNFCNRNGIISGFTGQFQKGCISHNKGKKGICAPGCEKGWFKKGSVPKNTATIGKETITRDGYIRVKIAEPNVWKLKHRYVYEQANGIELTDDDAIVFLDGNSQNCDINNLRRVSRAELLAINNSQRLQSDYPEINDVGITLTKLEMAIRKREKNE